MSQEKAEARAESMGYQDREIGQPRDANPYAQLTPQNEVERTVIGALVEAWGRGWDQANAVLTRRGNSP